VIAAGPCGVVEQDGQNLTDGHGVVKADAFGRHADLLELHMRMAQAPLFAKRFEPLANQLPVRGCRRAAAQTRERRRAQRHLLFEQFEVGAVWREPLVGARGVAQFFGQHRDCRQRRADFVCDRRSLHAQRDRPLVVQQALLRLSERCVT
jgi:hypothetical protein